MNHHKPHTSAHTQLKHVLDQAAHLLPMQGPIGVFIHHNTLHAFQHLPFDYAVVKAAQTFGTEPYMSEEQYRREFARGRIRAEDLDAVLNDEPDAPIWARALTRRGLRRAMLLPGVRTYSAANIGWLIDEESLLDRLRDDLDPVTKQNILQNAKGYEPRVAEAIAARALFAACYQRVPALTAKPTRPARRPQEAVFARTERNLDEEVNPLLIRLCAVFLDQGQAYWPMPGREKGFYLAVRDLFWQPGLYGLAPEPSALRGLREEWERQAAANLTATEAVLYFLIRFGVAEADWEAFLTAELLALPGWAGLMHRLEEEPSLAPHKNCPCSLMEYLAVRLTLMTVAAENFWREAGLTDNLWTQWQTPLKPAPVTEAEQLAAVAHVFDVAQLLGLSAGQLNSLSEMEFREFHYEIRVFDDLERRRVWHLAYERQHETMILAPLQTHRQTLKPDDFVTVERPAAQVMFCIDEREESMRRALEESTPSVETFGAAGFFGVAVNYQGLDDAHGVALCPVVVTPQHAVLEKPTKNHAELHAKRQQRRKLWAEITHNGFIGSRTLVRGWVGTIGFGLLSLFPLVTRVLAPRRAGQLYQWLSARFLPDPRTELTLMRPDNVGHHLTEDLLLGFTIQEKAERVAGVLRAAGLIKNHARIVAILGHGSTSLNNPHESAHDCGACGGRRGGPNARLFAAMANHPEVRKKLHTMGIEIPSDTWFVGGYHDTCNDDVIFFDTAEIPASHAADFGFISRALDEARALNALERSRRFEAAWKDETPEQALRHVQERAEHLAEPRPEYGHATNAVAIIGRRNLTRGLFLDRRSFLISYDATTDPEDKSLAALLAAGGPVCAGINLEYYFSFVDNERYGCGTKLPHNVTGLVGVMNGHASDLRTGLPWQMVEVHEPVRLLLIIESTPERVVAAAFQSAVVRELVENCWIRVATIDPDNGAIHVFRNGVFQRFEEQNAIVPEAPSSPEWYLGKLDHLPIARIRPQGGIGLRASA
jgi:uncharacterized protein